VPSANCRHLPRPLAGHRGHVQPGHDLVHGRGLLRVEAIGRRGEDRPDASHVGGRGSRPARLRPRHRGPAERAPLAYQIVNAPSEDGALADVAHARQDRRAARRALFGARGQLAAHVLLVGRVAVCLFPRRLPARLLGAGEAAQQRPRPRERPLTGGALDRVGKFRVRHLGGRPDLPRRARDDLALLGVREGLGGARVRPRPVAVHAERPVELARVVAARATTAGADVAGKGPHCAGVHCPRLDGGEGGGKETIALV